MKSKKSKTRNNQPHPPEHMPQVTYMMPPPGFQQYPPHMYPPQMYPNQHPFYT